MSAGRFNPFLFRQEMATEIRKIPKKNRAKFQVDLFRLIAYAQGADYENFNF